MAFAFKLIITLRKKIKGNKLSVFHIKLKNAYNPVSTNRKNY